MFDEIISKLQQQAGPALMDKLGLSQQQATGSIHAAADSVKQVIGGGDGFGLDDVLNLFSGAQNNTNANGILGNIGQVLHGKLTDQVGLDHAQASGVKNTLLPMLTDLVSGHVGGDANNLQSLFGGGGTGVGGGITDMAKGMLGKLFN